MFHPYFVDDKGGGLYIYINNMYIISILTDIIGAASGPPPTVLKLGNDSSMLLR